MNVLGIGIDVVNTQRIANLIRRRGPHRFASRILSKEELAEWTGINCPVRSTRYLAVRFSVKEAAYKALYPVVVPTWKDLTYKSYGALHSRSKPTLLYNTASTAPFGPIHVSVSHDGDYVVASVLAETIKQITN